MIRRSVFEAVGGFDAAFAVNYNDVDFCLKVVEAGYRTVYTPYAELIHYESASRIGAGTAGIGADEVALFQSRWGGRLARDPYYNPNFRQDGSSYLIAVPFRERPPPAHEAASARPLVGA